MIATLVIALSILVQLASAVVAVRLRVRTRRCLACLLILATIVLMAIRRFVSLYRVIEGAEIRVDLFAELIAFAVSAMFFLGVLYLSRLIIANAEAERLLLAERARLESANKLSAQTHASLHALLDAALEEAVSLCGSAYGYIYYYDEATEVFTLHAWSPGVMPECTIPNPRKAYHLPLTGIWGEAVRQRRAIVVNEFDAPNPLKKGYPEGHARLKRFMTVPVLSGGRIVAVVGAANKPGEYTDEDVRQVGMFMDHIWKVAERFEAQEALMRSDEQLRASLAEKEMLIREVHHRAKNNLMVVQSLLRLQSNTADDGAARELLIESQNRVQSMSIIHDMLHRSPDPRSLSLSDYLRAMVTRLFQVYQGGIPAVKLCFEVEDLTLDVDTVIPVGLIVNELVSNSLKHAFPEGREGSVCVSLRRTGAGRIALSVRDDGAGLPPGFELEGTSTLGMRIVGSLAKQVRGEIELIREGGTEFRIGLQG